MATGISLELKVNGDKEEREDRWAVESQEFGFIVYGKNEEEADKAFEEAIGAMLNSFSTWDDLRNYLITKNVHHQVPDEPGRHFSRSMEVLVDALA